MKKEKFTKGIIETVSSQIRESASREGKTVVVKMAFRDRRVRFMINKRTRQEGRLLSLDKSPLEVKPVCSIFPACGGIICIRQCLMKNS